MDLLPAYIDPGVGSLAIQAAIATAIAVPIFLRQHLRRLLQVVRQRGSNSGES